MSKADTVSIESVLKFICRMISATFLKMRFGSSFDALILRTDRGTDDHIASPDPTSEEAPDGAAAWIN